ncbi:MAG: hypothetical protein HFI67_12070, partial [Lachnospiraceae bacterium]|nr:hypothetical protein [Lachnospiraceae bacterium]
MANIERELQAILDAEYGEEVRGSIHDAIEAGNQEITEYGRKEEERNQAETARVNAENARTSAESKRKTAETARVTAENARKTAEESRVQSESGRVSAETARVSAEGGRTEAEASRARSETARVNAENARASAESSRMTAETTRMVEETKRVEAEVLRGQAEKLRKQAEEARAAAEELREAAKIAMEQATAAANTAAENANEAIKKVEHIDYGECSTAAATAAKTVACTGWILVKGASITVRFTVTNSAANPTLNVNGTGAKPIYYRGSAISAGNLAAGRTYLFVYNGIQFDMVGDFNTNTTYSAMTGATASAAGKAGLAPAPAKGAQTHYFTGGGTYQNVDDHTAVFTSLDVADGGAAEWTTVAKLASGETHKSILAKISSMFKNIRYLYKAVTEQKGNR